jgi:hypothetical protein
VVNKLEGAALLVASFQGEEGKAAGKYFVLFTGAHTKHSGLCAWKWMVLLPALLISASSPCSSYFPLFFTCHFVVFIILTLLAGPFCRNNDACSRVTFGHNCAQNKM